MTTATLHAPTWHALTDHQLTHATTAVEVLARPWTTRLLHAVHQRGPSTVAELARAIPHLTRSTAEDHLARLVDERLLHPLVHTGPALWALAPAGRALAPLYAQLLHWWPETSARCPRTQRIETALALLARRHTLLLLSTFAATGPATLHAIAHRLPTVSRATIYARGTHLLLRHLLTPTSGSDSARGQTYHLTPHAHALPPLLHRLATWHTTHHQPQPAPHRSPRLSYRPSDLFSEAAFDHVGDDRA
ncbi:winged helix-turn-helix transcriptional regulator [Streptomyces triticirhizae]|nr:winged helix-turn-helix transcriptional regulator [Streptomyces triticirhizae]